MQSFDQVRTLLLDIEGTTTPADFVFKVLFPYARRHLSEFIEVNHADAELQADLSALREEQEAEGRLDGSVPPRNESSVQAVVDSAVEFLYWLMDRDRKSTALKSLQGKIWHAGYLSGELKGRLYPDVPAAFQRWHSQGRRICIFSSGSALAQELLFRFSDAGDLTSYITNYFDTTIGFKREPQSYRRIARQLHAVPSEVLFLSDVVEELDAAKQAGMATILSVREGNTAQACLSHPVASTFDEVLP